MSMPMVSGYITHDPEIESHYGNIPTNKIEDLADKASKCIWFQCTTPGLEGDWITMFVRNDKWYMEWGTPAA